MGAGASPALEQARQLRALTRTATAPDVLPAGLVRGLAHLVEGTWSGMATAGLEDALTTGA